MKKTIALLAIIIIILTEVTYAAPSINLSEYSLLELEDLYIKLAKELEKQSPKKYNELYEKAKPKPTPAPSSGIYKVLDYEDTFRYPEKHSYEFVKFTGKVIQVLGSRKDGYTLRIATKGNYDNVVLATTSDPGFRTLEGDKLSVTAMFSEVYEYKTTLGGTNSLPLFLVISADLVK